MFGIAIELLLSFILLKYLAKRDLGVLGLWPSKKRTYHLLLGLVVPILFFFIFNFGVAYLVGNPYRANMGVSLSQVISAIAFIARSVVYEELLFRGALLWLLARRFGMEKAVFASAVVFGCYHWFAWNAFGNPVKMAIILFTTGSIGYILALAFVRTGSMYLSLGLHFSSNLCTMLIFPTSGQTFKPLLLKSFEVDAMVPGPWISLPVIVLHYIGLQLVCYLLVRHLGCKNRMSENDVNLG